LSNEGILSKRLDKQVNDYIITGTAALLRLGGLECRSVLLGESFGGALFKGGLTDDGEGGLGEASLGVWKYTPGKETQTKANGQGRPKPAISMYFGGPNHLRLSLVPNK